MQNIDSCYLWLVLCFMIFACELYVPYKKRLFLSLASGAFVCSFCSFLFRDIFRESLFFIIVSVFFYSASVVLSALCVHGRKGYCDVIALNDIDECSCGRVYCCNKGYIIKNNSGRKIKKGEVLRIERQHLEGESVVPK